MKNNTTRRAERQRRHKSIRKNVHGTQERPRLSVFRSHQHMYAQIIDDDKGHTLVAASTLELQQPDTPQGKVAVAEKIGEQVARKALAKGIEKVVFDRGGNLYHGRVAALADGARKAGLQF